MKKKFKFPVFCAKKCIFVPLLSVPQVLLSCANNPGGEISLSLNCDTNYIMPGGNVVVKPILSKGSNPFLLSSTNLLWSIDKTFDGMIEISNNGVISASSQLLVEAPTRITVTCSLEAMPSIIATYDLYVTNYTTSDFLGFENNEIKCLDRYHNVKTVKIKKSSNNVYTNEQIIDLFVMDSEHPKDWTSFFSFTPIIKLNSRPEMYFETDETDRKSINWLGSYMNGMPTTTIPDFTTSFSSNLFAYIDVTFKADKNIKLSLKFNLWEKEVSETCHMAYAKSDESDEHKIVESSISGDFTCKLFCPARTNNDEEIYEGVMKDIYVYRDNYQYLDLTFNCEENEDTKKKLNGAFTYEFSDFVYFQRSFDHYPFYKFSLTYKFDLSKMPKAEDLEYKSFELMSFKLSDPISPSYPHVINGICHFWLDWI